MIIVCGSGRSGTSAVARLLHAAGITMGRDLIEADEHNVEGYYEERAVVQINDAILGDLGLDRWFAVAGRAAVLAAARRRHDEMRALAAAATPGWKDPRFCWTLEAWLEVLPEPPRIVVCLRSPAEVAASTMRYYGLAGDEPARAVEHAWRAQYERLLDVIEGHRLDALTVDYGALHADPRRAVVPLSRFAGRALDPATVRRELRHHEARVAPELAPLYERVASLGAAWRSMSDGAR